MLEIHYPQFLFISSFLLNLIKIEQNSKEAQQLVDYPLYTISVFCPYLCQHKSSSFWFFLENYLNFLQIYIFLYFLILSLTLLKLCSKLNPHVALWLCWEFIRRYCWWWYSSADTISENGPSPILLGRVLPYQQVQHIILWI